MYFYTFSRAILISEGDTRSPLNYLALAGVFHLDPRHPGIDQRITRQIASLGIPSGLQVMMLSLASLFQQSAINALGTAVVAGQSASNNLMSIVAQGTPSHRWSLRSWTTPSYRNCPRN